MKKLMMAALFASVIALPGVGLADQGGVPNDNSFNGGPGSDTANGRKGNCVPPGAVFKETAKAPGPNNNPLADQGLPGSPGQVVKEQCTPNAPS